MSTSLRDALLAIGGLFAVLALVELAVPSTSSVTAAGVLDGVAVAAFTVTGLLAWHRRPHNRTGRLLVATAAALWAAGMRDDDVDALRTIGVLFESLPLAVMLHLLLAFPSGRLTTRGARLTAFSAYVVAIGPQLLRLLVNSDLGSGFRRVEFVLGLVVLGAAFVLTARRLSAAPPVLRRQLAPFVGYGCVAIAVIAVCISVLRTDPPPTVAGWVVLVEVAAICALPFAFLLGMLAGAFGRAGELEEIALGISEASADPALLDDLAVRALGDPSARVLWAIGPSDDGFVDSGGTPHAHPDGPGWCPIGPGEHPPGGLRYDHTLIADAGLVATVAAPMALAIENRRLVVDLRSAMHDLRSAAEEIRLSRRRIANTADAERRRIARDLHDGAQQRIVLIGIQAQRIGRGAEDPDFVRSVADRVSEQLRLLLDELRSLVQGIMPAALHERGLAAAIAALADEMPVPVQLEIDGSLGRMAPEVESTGLFVVTEALTNVTKHAEAQRVSIVVAQYDGRLVISVADDGRGMSHSGRGFGLVSLRDRVAALDGTVTVHAGARGGTILRAEFACA